MVVISTQMGNKVPECETHPGRAKGKRVKDRTPVKTQYLKTINNENSSNKKTFIEYLLRAR